MKITIGLPGELVRDFNKKAKNEGYTSRNKAMQQALERFTYESP